MSYLYLVRHTKSEWNEKGLWTGWSDPHLSVEGLRDAFEIGKVLQGEHIDISYLAPFCRTGETMKEIRRGMGVEIPVIEAAELKERNYGVFTGKNKWQIKGQVGDGEFQEIRRGWDHKIENGETLKDVYGRAVPYFISTILPQLKAGKNCIVVSSGNTLRSLVKYLDNIPDDKIGDLEIAMGEVLKYEFDQTGAIKGKTIAYSGVVDKEKKISR